MPSATSAIFVTALALVASASSGSASAIQIRNNDKNGFSPMSGPKARGNDPEFTLPALQLDSVLSCVGGLQNVKKPFLLVPGTSANATMAYDPGWRDFLGTIGYDVCYVAPPPYLSDDIQLSMEYIVNAVHRVHDASGKQKFPIMGHSQGGLDIQSALTYYPSIRKELASYVSLAGDVGGTLGVTPVPQANLTTTLKTPAVWQQGYLSDWILNLRKKGGRYNWIPTTTMFSLTDATVRPQTNATLEGSATFVAGKMAGNILVQEACPGLNVAHNEFLVAEFAYQVVKLLSTSKKGYVSPADVKKAVAAGQINCNTLYAPTADLGLYNNTLRLVGIYISNTVAVLPLTHAEPILRPYIRNAPNNEVHDA